MIDVSTEIAWREWGSDAFAEAREQDKPVLLDIGAVWCHWCHVMDAGIPGDPDHPGTYNQPAIQQRIADHFIPIKVDNDRRPDINARYNMGGWPTTAFLTPDGDTLYGETYVPPARMAGLLDYIWDIWHDRKDEVIAQTVQARLQRAAAQESPPSDDLDPDTAQTVTSAIIRSFDPEFGGFGTQPKFPHPDALLLTLEQYARTGDPALRTVAEKTLRGMSDGGMYDQFAGGFFRYSTTRDWSIPHFEKMLEDNAKLTHVYAVASQILDDPSLLDTVRSAHGWLLSDMRDSETGAFAGSQDADKEEAYYGQPLDVRAGLPTPYIDRTIYAGWNALMVSALLERYKITGEDDVYNSALQVFEFIVQELGEDDPSGRLLQYTIVRHYYSGGESQGSLGLLSDQTALIAAAVDFYEITGNVYFKYVANEAAEYVLDFLEDQENGGFFDFAPLPDAIGELAHPKKEMSENAEAALALLRLSRCGVADEPRPRLAAERALRLFVDEYAQSGYFAAAYARAVAAALAPALHLVVVGAPDHPDTWPMLQAAWQLVAPGKVVEPMTMEAAAQQNYPAGPDGAPRVYVCVGTTCNVATTPQELLERARYLRSGSQ